MADDFAARKCKDYIVVCLVPDFCHPGPFPYPAVIDLSGSANTSLNVNHNSDGAFLHEQSDTVKVEGDEPGVGLGVLSLSVSEKCKPITFSPIVRCNGKQHVKENDLFYCNIGEDDIPNTVSQLVCCESGSAASITDKGIKGKPAHEDTDDESLWEQAKGAAKETFNKFMRKNSATQAEWYAEEGIINYYDSSGQKMSSSAVYDAIANGDGSMLSSSNASQQAGADLVNQTPQVDSAIAIVTAIGTKGRDVLRDPQDFVAEVKKIGVKNKKKKKESLKCGEGGTYQKLKNKLAEAVGMERDHVPSGGALKQRALELNDGERLTDKQIRDVENIGHTLAIPKGIHATHSLTYKWLNTEEQIKKDAGNLKKAADRDLRAVKKGLSKECRQKYEKYAKKIRQITNEEYDEMLTKALKKKPRVLKK